MPRSGSPPWRRIPPARSSSPDTAHRSFFWGLIEYDTEVVLCFCLTECDIDINFWK
jgi:hypothetical protein